MSEIEKYLEEQLGDLPKYYSEIADGYPVGHAFISALCRPDIFRLRNAGKWTWDRTEELTVPQILELVKFLKEDLTNYPEDHSIWQLRR